MAKIETSFTGIRNSAFLTLYGRWRDSVDKHSILHDTWAAGAAEQLGFDFGRFAKFTYARFTIASRAKLLDDWTRRFLAGNPGAVVLDVGSGLDSRVFRVDPTPEHSWYDVDFPDIIAVRDSLYPPRPGHATVGADIADPDWLEAIARDRPVIVVADSVFMFLPGAQIQRFLRRVADHFPRGEVVFTAYSSLVKKREVTKGLPPFFEQNDIRMRWTYDGPDDITRLDDRLRVVERRSQTELRLHRDGPWWDKLMCAFVNSFPSARYAGTTIRCEFGTRT